MSRISLWIYFSWEYWLVLFLLTFLNFFFVLRFRLFIVFLCIAVTLYRKGIRAIESFAASGLIVWMIWVFFPPRIYVFGCWGSVIEFPYALFEVIFTYIITPRHNFSTIADVFSFTSHTYAIISSGCLTFVHSSLPTHLGLVMYLSLAGASQIFSTLAYIYIFVAITHVFIATVQIAITTIGVVITLANYLLVLAKIHGFHITIILFFFILNVSYLVLFTERIQI